MAKLKMGHTLKYQYAVMRALYRNLEMIPQDQATTVGSQQEYQRYQQKFRAFSGEQDSIPILLLITSHAIAVREPTARDPQSH